MKRELKEYGNNSYGILENGRVVYFKNSNGYSYECTYNKQGNPLTYKSSDGYSYKYTYDKEGNELTYKGSNGVSWEYTYDNNGKLLTKILNSELVYKREVKEMTLSQVIDELGYEIKLIKEEL